MEIREANKIIAEYMGWKIRYIGNFEPVEYFYEGPGNCIEDGGTCRYTGTLDSLVPVWEKMEGDISKPIVSRAYMRNDKERWGFRLWGTQSNLATSETIQEAACIATAKCIVELNKSPK